ncbi:GIY-YIG nuclease family protein [Fluctibacter halophilus]|uniref:GIY-YIG nuclease family protein n=1 Tax=Fluctibacter halophilus TaxID=226011 RepID=UPI001E42771A|nr:GIY-YIG nuclease family protein [Aestuariibacter halophilus]
MNTTWYLYIIENRLGQLYTGISTDPGRRFREHSEGGSKGAKSLRGKGPLTLKFCVSLADRRAALQAEHTVKRWPRSRKLALLSGCEEIPFDHTRQDISALLATDIDEASLISATTQAQSTQSQH